MEDFDTPGASSNTHGPNRNTENGRKRKKEPGRKRKRAKTEASNQDNIDPGNYDVHIYEQKDPNRLYGCGAVLIFPFFTKHLKGYTIDAQNIIDFFETTLNYTSFQAEPNLNKEKFFKCLTDFRNQIQNHKLDFDRLVVIILSHGEKDGFCTCAKPTGEQNDREGGTTKVKDILAFFKHDQLPKLKGCPKLFIVQACRGEGMAITAGTGDTNEPAICSSKQLESHNSSNSEIGSASTENNGDTDDSSEQLQFHEKIPIDADIEICYASTLDNRAMVDQYSGSWLIDHMLKIFRADMRIHHVADMLTKLRFRISEIRKTVGFKGQIVAGVQLPCASSTLRKQFWLSHGMIPRNHVYGMCALCKPLFSQPDH